jgi:FAD/FMN-containing dehydrogenase
MNDMSLTNLQAGKTTISGAAIEALAGQQRGSVLDASDASYDEARAIWNAMIDRRPGLIVQCAGAADVVNAVRFARDNNLLVAVRGGGHNIAGNAVCDGGLMIDLSPMKSLRVDAAAKRAWVEPGATLADVDKETQANGELVRASLTENPDLFWALRGGGGNFGIVTSFEFKLHELGPQVISGLIVHPFDDAQTVLEQYRQALETAPDELTCWAVMRQAPPLPFLPEEWHGKEVVVLAMCYCGDLDAGEKAIAKLRSIGKPIADVVGPNPFTGWQQAFDPLLTPGARNYWKSHDFTEFSDATIGILTDAVRELPGPECEIFVGHVGGAAGRVAVDATAFPQRNSHFVMNVHARWREPKMDRACIGWARNLFESAKPYAAGTAYINFMPEDEVDRVEAAYGSNYQRLAEVKRRYDPQNLFRMNQNVRPSEGLGVAA